MSQPAHKLRDRNPGEKGNWYSVIPSRSYRKGDVWQETESLGFDDLLAMSKLLSQAHSWIVEAKKADAKARKDAKESVRAAA
jgi:hypothetical protein